MSAAQIMERMGRVVDESLDGEIDWSQAKESTTIESFGLDSLALLDLIFDLEQEFSVQIQAEEMAEVKTLGELVELLQARIA